MGIADQMGWDNPFTQFVGQNRNTLMGFGAGLAGGRNFGQGVAAGLQGAQQGKMTDTLFAQQEEEKATKTAETSQTAAWLKANYPQYATLPVEQGWQMAMQDEAAKKSGIGGNAPSNVQEWEYYSQLTPEQQSQYLTMKRSNSPLNVGTGFVTQDMANPGQIIGAPIAINNEQEAFDKGFGGVTGSAAGEVAVLADSVTSKMPGLRSVVDTLSSLADTATYTQSGQAMDSVKRELGLPVGQGAIDRASYIAIVDNQVLPLLRDTFGAAFTEREGATLRATLGDPNKSPAEKKAILDAFIAQKERDVAAMATQSGKPVVRVFNPSTGRLE
jgi:hypothetical protein